VRFLSIRMPGAFGGPCKGCLRLLGGTGLKKHLTGRENPCERAGDARDSTCGGGKRAIQSGGTGCSSLSALSGGRGQGKSQEVFVEKVVKSPF